MILFVLGALSILGALIIGVLVFAASMAPAEFAVPGSGDAVGPFLAFVGVFGVIFAAVAILHIVGGVGILRRRTWGRVVGMVVSALGIVLSVISSVVGMVPSSQVDPFTGEPYPPMTSGELTFGIVLGATIVIAYLVVLVILTRRGADFG